MTTGQQAREALEVSADEARLALNTLDAIGERTESGEALAAKNFDIVDTFITQAAEDKRIADAVRGADKATVFDDNYIHHDDDCDPKHYGRVLIIPASVLEGE